MPNEETFPFTEISVKLYDGTSFTLNEKELAAALQYIPTQGYPPFVQVEQVISPRYPSRNIARDIPRVYSVKPEVTTRERVILPSRVGIARLARFQKGEREFVATRKHRENGVKIRRGRERVD